MQRTLLCTAVLLMLTGLAAGHAGPHTVPQGVAESSPADVEDVNLSAAADAFNKNADVLPGFVQRLIGGQRINLHLETSETNETIGVVMDGILINRTTEQPLDSPSMEIWLSQTAINEIMASDQPVREFSAKLQSGEIDYKVNGTGNKVMFWLTRNLLRLADVLNLV